MNSSKQNLMIGVPEISIQRLPPNREDMVLSNGVYVPCGKRPDKHVLQQMRQSLGSRVTGEVGERIIPGDQTTEDVLLGEFMDYGISPVTEKPINSEHVNNCIVVAAVGVALDGNDPTEQRGLYAHVNPAAAILKNNLTDQLVARIENLRSATHQFTRDILFAGGAWDIRTPQMATHTAMFWKMIIEKLTKCCEGLDIEPTVQLPLLESRDTFISLDTQQRVVRMRSRLEPKIQIPTEALPQTFPASQVDTIMKSLLDSMRWK